MRPLAIVLLMMFVVLVAPDVRAAERQGGGASLGLVCEPGTTFCTCRGENDCKRLEDRCPTPLVCDINDLVNWHCCCGTEEQCDPVIYPKPTRNFQTIVPNTPTFQFKLQQNGQ